MRLVPYRVESPLQGLRFRLSKKLTDRDPQEVWPGINNVAVTLRPFSGRFGNLKRYELMVLCAVAKYTAARAVFEFGTFDGLTTWHLAANSDPDARVWTLDLPLHHPARRAPYYDRGVGKIQGITVGQHYQGTSEAGRIQQLYEDSLLFDPQPFHQQMDFCFIDASHEYEHVCRDTENALKMVRAGGVIFWHDYSRWWPGVQKCLDDLSGALPVFRVAETALAAVCVSV
jgi:hypothetical protein